MRRFVWSWLPVLASLLLLCSCTSYADDEKEAKDEAEQPASEVTELTIGSKAPPLDVEHWVQNGNGKFTPVTEFKPGQVYVVEFWATWCGPCIASMPHLAETQQKYEKEVQLVSISDEDLKTVEGFLDGKVRGEDEKTYRELTSAYCLTTDPDRSNFEAYMVAAGQNGIPTAFIVGKDGHVEWIGHPMTMDEPLEQIVGDKWDRETFQKEFVARQQMEKKLAEVTKALRGGDVKEALAIMDQLIADSPEPLAQQLKRMKLQVLMQADTEQALELVKSLTADTEDGTALNEMAWLVYQYAAAGRDVGKELIEVAVVAGEKAVERSEGKNKGYALDTLAHLKHQQGDLDAAIKYQTQAAELAPEDQIKGYLEELQKAKDSPKEDDAKEETKDEEKKDDAKEDK